MPETSPLCRKCKVGLCSGEDSWCRICSCAGALNEVARYRFSSLSHRQLGEEIVVQATRQVQALVTLDKQVDSQVTSLSDRLRNAKEKLNENQETVDRTAAPKLKAETERQKLKQFVDTKIERARSSGRHREEEEPDFGDQSDFGEESEEEPVARKGDERPRSPPGPPPGRHGRERRRSRSRNRGRRGGVKHQQYHRALTAPDTVFHKKSHLEPLDLGKYPKGEKSKKR